jgi:hypothetical protein
MAANTPGFDPTRHMVKVSGRDYIEVKWRLVWAREEHPDLSVQTELLHHQNQTAIFRAKVSTPAGASATGHGMESADDFGDYLEKAETKALGRALAALGFGTQFVGFEFDDRQAMHARAEASATEPRQEAPPPSRRRETPAQASAPAQPAKPAKMDPREAALADLDAAVQEHGRTVQEVNDWIDWLYDGRFEAMTPDQIYELARQMHRGTVAQAKAKLAADAAAAEAPRSNPPGSGMDANLPPAFDDPEGFDDPPAEDHSPAATTPGPDNTPAPAPASAPKTPSDAPATPGMIDKIWTLIRGANVSIAASFQILEEHCGPCERVPDGKWPNKLADALPMMTAGQARIFNRRVKEWIAVHRPNS